jgi:hypothetical protein
MANKKATSDLTQLTVRQLRNRRRRLARDLPDLEELLRGSLLIQQRRCGKPGCRCARGELHGPYGYLSIGRNAPGARLLYVPEAMAQEVRRRVDLTEVAEAALAEISAINVELLARRELV